MSVLQKGVSRGLDLCGEIQPAKEAQEDFSEVVVFVLSIHRFKVIGEEEGIKGVSRLRE